MVCSNVEKMTRLKDEVAFSERSGAHGKHRKRGPREELTWYNADKSEKKMIRQRRRYCDINRARHERRGSHAYSWVERQNRACRTKSVYRSFEEAVQAALLITRDTRPLRPYECPWCHRWHLSSQIDLEPAE